MKRFFIILVAVIGGPIAPHTEAAITVVRANGITPVPASTYQLIHDGNGGWSVYITALYSNEIYSEFQIRATAGERFNNILVINVPPDPVEFALVRVLSQPSTLGIDSVARVGAISTVLGVDPHNVLIGVVDVNGDIGEVVGEQVNNVVTQSGDLIGPFRANTGGTSLQAPFGRLLGDVDVFSIGIIWANEGVGTALNPVSVRTFGPLGQFVADRSDVFADIDVGYYGGIGTLQFLECGDFTGSVRVQKFGVVSVGAPSPRLRMLDSFVGSISVDEGFSDPAWFMQFAASGLSGQIIIGANGSGSHAWTSPIRVGPNGSPSQIILSPNYPNTAASLGGGSAGAVPFDLHGTDSVPLNGASVPFDAARPGPGNPIRIRLYGPITYTSGQVPVTMWAEASGSAEQNQSSCLVNAAASVQRDAVNGTILVVTPERLLQNGYTYHIRPKVVLDAIDTLNCDIPSPKPVAAWEYTFCVGTQFAADINGDRKVNTYEFNLVANSLGTTGCLLPADVNADGTVDIGDFNIIAGHFGEVEADIAATCDAVMLMRGDGEDEEMNQLEAAVLEMGFESLGDFSAWLEELSEEEQLEVLMELIARLGE